MATRLSTIAVAIFALTGIGGASASDFPKPTFRLLYTNKAPESGTGLDLRFETHLETAAPIVTRFSIELPQGTVIKKSVVPACRLNDVWIDAVDSCPANTRIGLGSLEQILGAKFVRVFMFNAPRGQVIYTFEDRGDHRFLDVHRGKLSGRLLTGRVAHRVPRNGLTAAITKFKLGIPSIRNAKGRFITTPRSCPAARAWKTTLRLVGWIDVRAIGRAPCRPAS